MTYTTSVFLASRYIATSMTSVQIKILEKLRSQQVATSRVLISAVTG